MDKVNTMREPARIPGLILGKTIVKNLVQKGAPKLAAPSSNSLKFVDDNTARTDRTINGNVKTTCPTSIKYQLDLNSRYPPYIIINERAIAKPGTATGNTIVSSINLDIRPPILAKTYAAGIPMINVVNKHVIAINIERYIVSEYNPKTSIIHLKVKPLFIPTKKFSVIPASTERNTGIIKKEQTRRVNTSCKIKICFLLIHQLTRNGNCLTGKTSRNK